jgi:pyrroline-5-carboxylate reductase
MAELAEQIRGKISKRGILISIAAGVPIKKLAKLFYHQKIVRVMPNLGLSVGQGIAVYKIAGLTQAEKAKMANLLSEFTENFEVENEDLIDAATAISGSGPAYFFFLADNLIKAAVQMGFNKAQARLLVEKTMTASAMLQENQTYEDLIKKISSKKGTTEAALKTFNKKRAPEIIKSAVRAAFLRARELSRG